MGNDHILITGKRWDRMFKVTLNDWPSLFANNKAVIADSESKPQLEEPEQNDVAEESITEEESIAGGENVAEQEEMVGEEANQVEVVDNVVQSQNAISSAYTVIEQVSHDRNSFT